MKDRFKGLHGDLFTPATDLVLTTPAGPTADDAEQEAVAALVALGYKTTRGQPDGEQNRPSGC